MREEKSVKGLWAPLLVAALAAGIFGLYGFEGELVRDDAVYLYSGQQMAEGTPPYRSIFDQKTPLAAMAAGAGVLLARLLGADDVLTVRVLFLVIGALAAAGVYLLADELLRSRRAAFLAACSFINFWGFGHQSASGPRAKTPMLLFHVLALWLATRRQWFLAGISGSLAALAWQPAAITLVVTALLAWVQSESGVNRRRSLLKVCAGGAVPFVAVSAYFLAKGAFFSFMDGAVLFVFTYFERVPDTFTGNMADMARALHEGYGTMFVPALLGFSALALIFVQRLALHGGRFGSWISRDSHAALLLTFPLFVLYSLFDFQAYADFYVLLPYAAVGFAWLLHMALGGMESAGEASPFPARLAAIVVCIALLTAAAWMYGYTGKMDHKLMEQRQWAAMIASSFPGDEVIVSVGLPQALVLLHRTNPNPYVYVLNGMDEKIDAETPGGFAGWLDGIGAQDPAAILYGDTRGRNRRKLEEWLQSRYRLIRVGEWEVYVK
jgi:hypothetical protein